MSTLTTRSAPEPRGPYPHCRNEFARVTAQIGRDPATQQFVDEEDLDEMNRISGAQFAEPYPARTSYGAAILWKGACVHINAVAMAGER